MSPAWLTSKTKVLVVLIIPILFIQANAVSVTDGFITHCVEGSVDTENGPQVIPTLLSDLASTSSTKSFYSTKAGSGANTLYGLFYCTANLDPKDCQSCVQTGAKDLQSECPNYKQAYIIHDDCTLRYSNLAATEDDAFSYVEYSTMAVSDDGFLQTLYSMLNKITPLAAASSLGFATDKAKLKPSGDKLYALAQCTLDILGSPCEKCLQTALQNVSNYCGKSSCSPQTASLVSARPSCNLRYDVRSVTERNPQWFKSTAASPRGNGGMNIWYVILLALSVASFLHFSDCSYAFVE